MCTRYRERKSVSLRLWHSSVCNTASCTRQAFEVLSRDGLRCDGCMAVDESDSLVHLLTLALAKHICDWVRICGQHWVLESWPNNLLQLAAHRAQKLFLPHRCSRGSERALVT